MKKLIRISTVPESLLSLLKGQLKYLNNHYEVVGISSDEDNLYKLQENEGVRVVPVNMFRRVSLLKDIISIYKMYKVFKREKPYIIHSITPKAGFISMIAGYLARVPHRIHTFTGLVFPSRKGIMRTILLNTDKIICKCATIIIPEGNGVKNELIINKVTRKELNVIANGNVNGIDLDFFKSEQNIQKCNILKQQLGINVNEIVITFIGRIVVDKGINELIAAFLDVFSTHKNIKLLIVGPFQKQIDPIPEETERTILEHPNIIYLGFRDDVRPFLEISNIFILPSYREGFPNVVIQAGAMDLPCIVTDISGANEIIVNGLNGLIVPVKNISALKNAMIQLIVNNEERFEMSKISRKMIVDRYDQKVVWSETLKLYNSLN